MKREAVYATVGEVAEYGRVGILKKETSNKPALVKWKQYRPGGISIVIEHSEDGLGPLAPTPQDYGFPEKPTLQQRDAWENQQRFLRRYAERGKLALSAGDVGISVAAVEKWQRLDKYSFNKRLELAYQAYRESLEEQMDEFIRDSKHNTQIIQIFRLKAAWPEKYRDDARPVSDDPSRQLLDRLTEMARKEMEERQRLEEGSVEAEYRDLGEADKS
jgi:hypothetical protein